MALQFKLPLQSKIHDIMFRRVHNSNLIYNACWEDPRIDRQLLELDAGSQVVMLTSAGCNALDYLLDSPAEIHAVDVNPRQNALLELKLALIQHRSHDDLFSMFGKGWHEDPTAVIEDLKPYLQPETYEFWFDKAYYFDKKRNLGSFYYCGSSGKVAWFVRRYIHHAKQDLLYHAYRLLDAQTLAEQRVLYDEIEEHFWDRFNSWLVQRAMVMSMVGVTRAQIELMNEANDEGVKGFVKQQLRHLLTEVPIRDNYFWRAYVTGRYTETCCPNYLKPENFELLRQNANRIHLHTGTLADFLRDNPEKYSHFILLDHQDWLASHAPEALEEEWLWILVNSNPGTKILMRSASPTVDFLPPVVPSKLCFHPERTDILHQQDRVGTYASLHMAEVL
ncbi:MAG: BtaA family protein [Chloroflexota bacterium]